MRLLVLALTCVAPHAFAEDLKILPFENACIEYTNSGMMAGTSLQCYTQYGNETYSQENMVMELLGVKQDMSSLTITQGADIYDVDLQSMTATKTKNPMYDQVLANAGGDPQAFGEQFLVSMGFAKTDKTMEFAGQSCSVYEGAMGQVCNTEDGLGLYSNIMGMEKTATRVGIDEEPPAELLGILDKVQIVEGPEMPQGMGDMGATPEGMPDGVMEMLKELGLGAQPQ